MPTKDNWRVKSLKITVFTILTFAFFTLALGRVSYATACGLTFPCPDGWTCNYTSPESGICVEDDPVGGCVADPSSCSGECVQCNTSTGACEDISFCIPTSDCRDDPSLCGECQECNAFGTCSADPSCTPASDCRTDSSLCDECYPCNQVSGTCSLTSTCIPEDEDTSCTTEGCGDPVCGTGYSCDEGECVFNTNCVGSVIEVPYTGPQIESLSKLLALIYNILFPGALLIGVIMIIKGGYELMTSEGNPQLARAGQEDLTAAVFGTIFIVMSGLILRMVIVQILGGTVGF